MKKDFTYYYNLYKNGAEKLYDELNYSIILELQRECDKDLAYYEVRCWLDNMEEYYGKKIDKTLFIEEEDL